MNETKPIYSILLSNERGHADHGWLKSMHTFSFGDYHDPAYMGFRTLRVINQDQVAPGEGFPTHPHRDMEIFSYILEGELAHEDSMGNKRTLRPGEVQLMSAGSGLTHSEFNPSKEKPLHFLQIWIYPNKTGLTPCYTEWKPSDQSSLKTLLISPNGQNGSATINQDAYIYRLRFAAGDFMTHDLTSGRGLWLQVITGQISINDNTLRPGDALSTEHDGSIEIKAEENAEALLFDLA